MTWDYLMYLSAHQSWWTWENILQVFAITVQILTAMWFLWCTLQIRMSKKYPRRPKAVNVPEILARTVESTEDRKRITRANARTGYDGVVSSVAAGRASKILLSIPEMALKQWDKGHNVFLMPIVAACLRTRHGDMHYGSPMASGCVSAEGMAHILESFLDMDPSTIIACNEVFKQTVASGGNGTDAFAGTINYMRARVLMEGDAAVD